MTASFSAAVPARQEDGLHKAVEQLLMSIYSVTCRTGPSLNSCLSGAAAQCATSIDLLQSTLANIDAASTRIHCQSQGCKAAHLRMRA